MLYPNYNPEIWNSQGEILHYYGIIKGAIFVLFAERLQNLMQDNGITNYRLSKLLGCSATTVANWLTGKEATQSYIQKLSEIFKVSTDYLIGISDQKEKTSAKAEDEDDPLSQVSFALFGTHDEIDEDILNDVREFARFKIEQKRKAAEEKK